MKINDCERAVNSTQLKVGCLQITFTSRCKLITLFCTDFFCSLCLSRRSSRADFLSSKPSSEAISLQWLSRIRREWKCCLLLDYRQIPARVARRLLVFLWSIFSNHSEHSNVLHLERTPFLSCGDFQASQMQISKTSHGSQIILSSQMRFGPDHYPPVCDLGGAQMKQTLNNFQSVTVFKR